MNLTVANARPHDLYFHAEPEEMITGRVDPPGIFLNASAVLERQFTAFCFDRWVESGIAEATLPQRIGQVLNNLAPADDRKFPYTFLRFIETHQTELFTRFIGLFAETLTPESIAHLQVFVAGDQGQEASLQYAIIAGLHALLRERESLRKKIRTLRDKIRRKEETPVRDRNYEKELGELIRERNALQELATRINDRETFNFFTDEGFLPNYTFPEAGVVLRSIIYRKKEEVEAGGGTYETHIYEYERAAASAIDELAPANHFYAGGRKVQVDQVDMAVSEVETWRFCNLCSHLELSGKEEEKPTCPRCGSTLWADAGQKRPMLRMRQVFATTSDRESLIGDDSDDREPNFYNKQILVDFEDHHITDAYRIDDEDLPFGFEFLARATFREINFGEKSETGERVVIAGLELPRQGFTVCRSCGKVQNQKGEIRHALTCTARDQGSDKNLTDCIYLYREFVSEAIRMLLPVTTFAGSDQKLHSFVAALQLGLKRKFGGNIDHLQTTLVEEPIPDSAYRKKYLVLYDTIPGGTGYLKQLMRSEQPLLEVFALARDALRSCPCNHDPGKDGCYRCLFAYRSSYYMADTSRNTAVELLSDILQRSDRLTRTDTLRNVPVNALFDSELEARFIEALRRMRSDEMPISLSKELVNGKPGYFLRIGERAYYIEPQVYLGPEESVSIPTRADFVFRPARGQDSVKPLAIFMDGYLYHRNRVGQDMAQRMAIVQSGRYQVWSLTWKDVENRYRSQGDYFRNYLDPSRAPSGSNFAALLDGYGLSHFRDAHRVDSFDWLIRFLRTPHEGQWQLYAFVHGLLHLDLRRFAAPQAVTDQWTIPVERLVPGAVADIMKEAREPCLYGLFAPHERGEQETLLQLFVVVEKAAVSPPGDPAGMRIMCFFADGPEHREGQEFEAVWNGYLRLHNLFQFLPYGFFLSQSGLTEGIYMSLRLREAAFLKAESERAKGDAWAGVREVTDPKLHTLLDRLADNGWSVPTAGFELTDAGGEIIATAEFAWADLHIAFLREEERGYTSIFEETGWQVVQLEEVLTDPQRYMLLHNCRAEGLQ